MRRSVIVVLVGVVFGALASAACLPPGGPSAAAEGPGSFVSSPPDTRPAASRPAPLRPEEVEVAADVRGAWSWALRELGTGTVVGDGTLRNTAESMIKIWLAVDFLATRDSRIAAGDEDRLTRMIRAGDDHAAQTLYLRLGGDASIARMVRTCALRETRIHPGWWTRTTMSAADATLLGRCVTRGPGLSPVWRAKLLDLMRPAEPGVAFGIPEAPALAGRSPAVGNGWSRHGSWWAVTCLAIWDHWALAVMVHYPDQGDEQRYGAGVCKTVAQRLFGRADIGFAAVAGHP
ncbi:serine hydrolase [Amycolatopsis sp. NPDC049252]|uniref:serine hydrolase n=1 Tax=Amycolatopsis sp. NPDC049252 TaxID=3363933 RepID=UPI003721136B